MIVSKPFFLGQYNTGCFTPTGPTRSHLSILPHTLRVVAVNKGLQEYMSLTDSCLALWTYKGFAGAYPSQGWILGFVNIGMIASPHLFLFFLKKVCRSGLCSHWAENKEAEAEMLSKCAFTMVILNKMQKKCKRVLPWGNSFSGLQRMAVLLLFEILS